MSSQMLDKKLDFSLDDLIKQASQVKRPTARTTNAKSAPATRGMGLAPKLIGKAAGARVPVGTASTGVRGGIAGKRQVMRTRRQAQATTANPGVQGRAPRILQLKPSDLKRRGAGAVAGGRTPTAVVNVRRNLARRIVNKAVMAPKQVAVAAPRQRVAAQRPQAAAAPILRGRQQPQPRQQILYGQQQGTNRQQQQLPPKQQQQVPVSLARRVRMQRQEAQHAAAPQRGHVAGQRGQQVALIQQGGQRRQQAQGQRKLAPRMLPPPRQQQQRQMLGRVQQGGVRKNRQQVQQPPPKRAPVFTGYAAANGRNANQQQGQQQGRQQAGAVQRQQQARGNNQRGGGRNQQQGRAGNQRQRAPITTQQQGNGNAPVRAAGGRGRRGQR